MPKEEKLIYMSRDPFARETRVKRYWGQGECGWCGRKGKQWEYGSESDSGRTGFTKGHYCGKSCHDSYNM